MWNRQRRGAGVPRQLSDEDAISYLRARQITLIYDPRIGTLQAGTPEPVATVTGRAS